MQRIRFTLSLSEEQYISYYRGEAKMVSVVADDGRRVEFPASCLRPYVSHNGIDGRFELQYTDTGKFIQLLKLELS